MCAECDDWQYCGLTHIKCGDCKEDFWLEEIPINEQFCDVEIRGRVSNQGMLLYPLEYTSIACDSEDSNSTVFEDAGIGHGQTQAASASVSEEAPTTSGTGVIIQESSTESIPDPENEPVQVVSLTIIA